MKAFGNLLVEPYISIGPLRLNEDREIIREKINEPFDARVNEFDGLQDNFDYFTDSIFLVHYDKNNKAIAFEFFEECEHNLIFNGVDLRGLPFVELTNMFSEIDPSLFVDDSSFISNKFGISAYCPYTGTDGLAHSETVTIFAKGYYDSIKMF